MIFSATSIDGVVTIDTSPIVDERGWFTRTYCPEEFATAGYQFSPVQTSVAHNHLALTLRGLHWQVDPEAETKLIKVTRGRAYDVVVDIRPTSPTYRKWISFDLDATSSRSILVGPGIAHGYMTLEAQTDFLYQISPAFRPGFARGARWDDSAFKIQWPYKPLIVSQKDKDFPPFL